MTAPTSQRMEELDVLRGFAVLGILVMNIQVFAMPMAAYLNPTVWGSLSGADGVVWYLGHLLTDQKMMTLFSMLFGAGIVLFTDRAVDKGVSPTALHYRRNAWLLLFGAIHAYLLWHGDILFIYAICAFVVYPMRHLAPVRLLAAGLVFIAVSSLIYILSGLSLSDMPQDVLEEMVLASWDPSAEALGAEVAAYQGSWLMQLQQRIPAALEMHTFVMLIWAFWRAAGLMLVGMGLYRLGVISGNASTVTYWRMLIGGAVIGLPVVAWGIHWNFANDWAPTSLFFGSQFNYWGSLAVSLAWLALVMLLIRYSRLVGATRRLAAVGRMAFSNYIMHTLLCGLIFYGHGLGLFGEVSRTGQIGIVFAIWALQLWLSPIWLRHFRFGPLEWLWRSLTYWQRQPFRQAGQA